MVVTRPKLWLLLALPLLAVLPAQAVKVVGYVQQKEITLSEQLQVVLEINSDERLNIESPRAPKIEGFSYRNMRNSSSSETALINGNLSRSYTLTYSYYYNPQRTGKFSIPGFRLRIGNRDYSTQTLSVEVVDSPSNQSQQFNTNPYIDPYGSSFFGRNRTAGESLILAAPQSQSGYVGEPAVISYYLYTNQMVESFSTETEKDYEGYGKSSFEQPPNLKYEQVTYKGERYQRALIKKLVLYPQVAGRLQVPTLTGIVQFSGVYSFLNKNISSQPLWLEVNALPGGKPAGYTGAVGNFTLSQTYSDDKVTQGEALVCTIKISGTGNFSQFTAPPFPPLAKFQISEPSLQDKLANPVEGTRFIYFTILPSETGSFQIPGFNFSWFDTSAGKYRTFTGPSLELTVKGSNVLSYFSGLLQSGKPKTLNPLLERKSYPAFRNFSARIWFWLVLAACLLALAGAGFMAYERRLNRLDPNHYAQKTANRILNKYLHQATEAAQSMSADFYPLAESGLLSFLAKKYFVSKGLTTPELVSALAEKQLPVPLLKQIEEFLTHCQKARYMPGGDAAESLRDALNMLRSLVQAFSRIRQPLNSGFLSGGRKLILPGRHQREVTK